MTKKTSLKIRCRSTKLNCEVEITNLKLVSIDEHGDEIPLSRVSLPVVAAAPSLGLPTPDPTPPLSLRKEEDPFNKAVAPAAKSNAASSKQDNTAHDSPANFAYVGDMKLFGVIPAQMYIYEHVSDILHPYAEVVKLAFCKQLSLGTLLPSIKGSEWDAICLDNPILGFQESVTMNGALYRHRGLYFETDIIFQGILQPVSDFLRKFFRQENLAIRLSTWLGEEHSYRSPINLSTFMLRGSLEHVSVNVMDVLEFYEIGLELTGHNIYDTAEKGMKWNYSYGFFGKLNGAFLVQ